MKNLKITKVEYIRDLILNIHFNDGKVQEVNFRSFLENAQHPEITKYLNAKNFKQYELVDGDLIWNDYDLVFPLWDLYTNNLSPASIDKTQAS